MKNGMIKQMAVLTYVSAMCLALSSCGVDPRKAASVLESQGYKEVQIGGYSWFGCGKDDSFASTFTALGQNGARVSGSVCSGMFKGTTVRFD